MGPHKHVLCLKGEEVSRMGCCGSKGVIEENLLLKAVHCKFCNSSMDLTSLAGGFDGYVRCYNCREIGRCTIRGPPPAKIEAAGQ
jgi:hypothetical protein